MLRGLYTAASGMIAQQRRHDTLTNNISNLNTPGYKSDNPVLRSFPEYLISRLGESPKPVIAPRIGRLSQGVFAEEKMPSYAQGDLNETGSLFDFAIVSDLRVEGKQFGVSGKHVSEDGEITYQPQAFFTVVGEDGQIRYTRNGRFILNTENQLTTPDGFKVLGNDNNPIQFANRNKVKMDTQGKVYDSETGDPITDVKPFLLTRVENPQRLIREGNGVFRLNPDETETRPIGFNDLVEIHQRHLERSNVDPTQTMVDMMAALRAYESNQKMIQFYDRSMEKAVNEVGRIY